MSYWIVYQGPKQRRLYLVANGSWRSNWAVAKHFSHADADRQVEALKAQVKGSLFGSIEVKDTTPEAA